jgi:hypothetical protein
MRLGRHLRELSGLRVGVVVSLVLASFVAISSAYRISPFPPSVTPRALGMAAASTHVLVDSQSPALLDLRQGADQLTSMTQRALLLGNVMASLPVREYIARRSGIPAQLIQVTAPVTPQYPRAIVDPAHQPQMTDILRSNNQYRIDVKTNPTVPMIDVYSEASNAATAVTLANAAVDGLRDYLTTLAQSQHVPVAAQVRLEQLGRAQGASVTGGLQVEVVSLVFLFTFALSCTATVFIARVIRGWRLSPAVEPQHLASWAPPSIPVEQLHPMRVGRSGLTDGWLYPRRGEHEPADRD